jgi:hypothetical protein
MLRLLNFITIPYGECNLTYEAFVNGVIPDTSVHFVVATGFDLTNVARKEDRKLYIYQEYKISSDVYFN